ncbi:hypothetical protein ACUXK4_003086 [Methylorubrum extorquens]
MKSLLQATLVARVAREHNLATKHYKNAFRCYAGGKRLLASKEKRLALQHSRKAKALESGLIPGIHFDEDANICAQSAWRFLS